MDRGQVVKRRKPTTPEVAALEARVVRLADLRQRAHDVMRALSMSWNAERKYDAERRYAMLGSQLRLAVNKLREARRNR